MFKKAKEYLSKYKYRLCFSFLVALVMLASSVIPNISIERQVDVDDYGNVVELEYYTGNGERAPPDALSIGIGEYVITIGMEGDILAAGVADYTCDGVDDDVQFQAALDALPAGGGKIVALTGNFVFGATVLRAIDNVEIQGNGYATYFANDGGTALFSAGAQSNWIFRDFRTDAGGITEGAASDWVYENIWEGASYWQLAVDSTITATNYDIPFADTDHSATHESGGSDAIKLDDLATPDDNVDLNASATRHGLLLKLDNTGTKFLRDDGTWQVAGGGAAAPPRSVVVLVAASDATANEKAQADYLCDGTDDWDDVETAISVANGGIVQLSSGTFYFDQGEICYIDDCTVMGHGSCYYYLTNGTMIDLDGNADGTRIREGGKLQHLSIDTPTSYSGIACDIHPTDVVAAVTMADENDVLLDVSFHGDITNHTGTAVRLNVDSNGANHSIANCSFNRVTIQGYSKGCHVLCDEPSDTAWINSNKLNQWHIMNTTNPFYFETDGAGAGEITGNIISDAIVEAASFTSDVIYWKRTAGTGTMTDNNWDNLMAMDWSNLTGNVANYSTAGAARNTISGQLAGYNDPAGTDNAAQNYILDQSYTLYPFNYRVVADGQFSGIYTWGTANAIWAPGDLVYHLAGPNWALADADFEAPAQAPLGLVMDTSVAWERCRILLYGTMHLDAWGWTIGDQLFMDTTAGDMNHTAPSASGDFVRMVGWGYEDADCVLFDPDGDYYELDAVGINKINDIAINP